MAPWDLVVSNPPYVLPRRSSLLEPEVREWEPRGALVGRRRDRGGRASAPSTCFGRADALVLEVAAGDAQRVAGLLVDLGYEEVTVTNRPGRPGQGRRGRDHIGRLT